MADGPTPQRHLDGVGLTRCDDAGAGVDNDNSYRWCPHHVADGDIAVDWSKYSSLSWKELQTLPQSLRIAPSGKLADTLRLLCKQLGLPEDGNAQKDCVGRIFQYFRDPTNTLPTASPAAPAAASLSLTFCPHCLLAPTPASWAEFRPGCRRGWCGCLGAP